MSVEDISKLRRRFADAINAGVISKDGKDTFEAVLLQIVNEADKQRQSNLNQADALRRQASALDGQANAFSSVASIVYSVLNGYVTAQERALEDERRVAAEMAEKLENTESVRVSEMPPPGEEGKKKVKK
jgi:hypothetical protein